ncbi:hypothetical protein M0R04_15685 [Candidatus Dojkabacteria bacterium]|jgi:hypothetical protein|nr:hypothetical protein [Candidatus Dojkabacteria bacterium]
MEKNNNWLLISCIIVSLLVGMIIGYGFMPVKTKVIASNCQICPEIPVSECPDCNCQEDQTPTVIERKTIVNPLKTQIDPNQAVVSITTPTKEHSLISTRSCRSWLLNKGFSENQKTPFCWNNRMIQSMTNTYKKYNREDILTGCQMYYIGEKCTTVK